MRLISIEVSGLVNVSRSAAPARGAGRNPPNRFQRNSLNREGDLILVTVGNHDHIARFVRNE